MISPRRRFESASAATPFYLSLMRCRHAAAYATLFLFFAALLLLLLMPRFIRGHISRRYRYALRVVIRARC